MKFKIIFILLVNVIYLSAQKINNIDLKEGDILFQNIECGELCEAINKVTNGINNRKFSHCGLVIKINDSLQIIEASQGNVHLSSIEKFIKKSDDINDIKNIVIGRLKSDYQNVIPYISSTSMMYINIPYDDFFVMNNDKLYCSELIYEIFKNISKDDNFFVLYPMTFKSTKTNKFFPVWKNYYKKLNYSIPQGKLGLNPGSISLSDKLDILNL